MASPGRQRGIREDASTAEQPTPADPPVDPSASDDRSGTEEEKSCAEPNPVNLRAVIREGKHVRLKRLLAKQRTEELTEISQEYGGGSEPGGKDKEGLYGGTSPLLHAASLGQVSIVAIILEHLTQLSLREEGILHSQLTKKDDRQRTVLQLAALRGSAETFVAVLDACRRERVSQDEMVDMLTMPDNTRTKSTALMAAAGSGSKRIFEAALEATERALTATGKSHEDRLRRSIEVRRMQATGIVPIFAAGEQLTKKDGVGRSLLHLAATSGKKRAVDAVWDAYRRSPELDESQIERMFTWTDDDGISTLMAAAESGCGETFDATLSYMRTAFGMDKLVVLAKDALRFEKKLMERWSKEDRLKNCLMSKTNEGQGLLELAVTSGNKSAVDAVWKVCRGVGLKAVELKDSRLHRTLLKMGGQHHALREVRVISGGEGSLDVVWEARKQHDRSHELAGFSDEKDALALHTIWKARHQLGLKTTEKRGIMASKDVIGDTLLSKAVDSGDVQVFKAVRNLAWRSLEPHQLASLVASKNIFGESLLAKAFDSTDVDVNLENLENLEVLEDLEGLEDVKGLEALKNLVALFEAVLELAWVTLPHDKASSAWQLLELIESRDVDGTMPAGYPRKALTLAKLLLPKAFDTGDLGLFEAAVNCVVGRGTSTSNEDTPNSVCQDTPNSVCQETPFVRDCEAVVEETILKSLDGGESLFACATRELLLLSADCDDFRGKFFSPALDTKVATLRTLHMDRVFSSCVDRHLGSHGYNDGLKTLSSLLAHSARPSPVDLRDLSRRYDFGDLFKECCLRAVTYAANPFIPGITLSIRLGEAAELANEGERRTIKGIQSSVVELLLSMFEGLPSTVGGFEQIAGRGACAQLLEPKLVGLDADDEYVELSEGPLDMILSERQQLETFCKASLVMDFLSREFSLGLPNLKVDIANVLPGLTGEERADDIYKGWNELSYVVENGLVAVNDADTWWFKCLERAGVGTGCLNFFPAADFILQGMFTTPSQYYRVPVMRMALDFVVYLGMVAALSYFVLFHSAAGTPGDDGIVGREFSKAECVCALIFVTAGVYREGREIRTDIGKYLKDKWNVLDTLGLLCVLIGLVIRWDDWSSPWGPAFYALSAPLVVARVLFFAQVLPFQGPMIQVIFRMASKTLQFSAVMSVIMVGFAMAIHALLRDSLTFGETFFGLFEAMLGDTELFGEFSGGRYDGVGTFLLVVYMFIVTIMLLNLLIAILSTAHDKVEENIERESKTSRARIFAHYRDVVDKDLLPAPFNLVNLVLSLVTFLFLLPFILLGSVVCFVVTRGGDSMVYFLLALWDISQKWKTLIIRIVGRVLFWILLTPLAFAGAVVLNFLACPYALYMCYKQQEMGRPRLGKDKNKNAVFLWARAMCKWLIFLELKLMFILAMCVVGLVLYCWQWLIGTIRLACLLCRTGGAEDGTSTFRRTVIVERILRQGSRGAGADKLLEFLENPMDDDHVRQDEKDMNPTVEHVKFLRDRLESRVASKREVEKLRNDVKEVTCVVKRLKEGALSSSDGLRRF